MNREEALSLVNSSTSNRNLVKHMYAAEACMRRLAEHFGEDPQDWSIAGLVHDIDYDSTKDDFSKHGLESARILADRGLCMDVIDAVKAHASKKIIEKRIEQALYAVDPMTGLIVASALMHPDKKIKSLDAQFVLNRFREKRFAAGANRQQIMTCERMGLSLEDFTGICLEAMKSIDSDLGL
ncbi:MAG: HD domain-containing protein [Elusimicrobia bacterium]|nr:HD domain-containing protein [Elusimicrobiota bacterium]